MSNQVESQIVEMKFNNSAFERGVATTLNTLSRLKNALNFRGSQKSLSELNATASKTNLTPLSTSVDSITSRFSNMAVVAMTALSNIANRAVDTGITMAKSLTVDPIVGGLREYETNLNSIQTILANTQVSGATLDDVKASLGELNEYSDKTIYNFSQMASNIGTFTAAGVDLDTSVKSIKGIANLAALSGSSSEKAANAMYQLSQALAAGRVTVQDWNSVVTAGMGGGTFQRMLAETAVAMGAIDKSAVKLDGKMKSVTVHGQSFRESIMAKPGQESWLTAEVLNSTLSQLTGDLSDAEVKALGFTDAQVAEIQKMAGTAVSAATEVKTLTAVWDTAGEVTGSGWAKTWELVFGDFEEAKSQFTSLSNFVNGFIGQSADHRNELITQWREMGGLSIAVGGLEAGFKALMAVLKPIKKAWSDVFGNVDADTLMGLSVGFHNLMTALRPSAETAENIRRTFAGVFAVFSIVKQVVMAVVTAFGKLAGGSAGLLNLTGNVGDFLVKMEAWIEKTGVFNSVMTVLGSILAVPINLLTKLADAFFGLFGSFDSTDVKGIGDRFSDWETQLGPLYKIGKGIAAIFMGVVDSIKRVGSVFEPFFDKVGDLFATMGEKLVNMDFSQILDVINTALLGGILLLIKNFLSGGMNLNIGEGLFGSIQTAFEEMAGTLKAVQAQVNSVTLMQIAAAILILALAVVMLASVDGDKLKNSMFTLTVAFGQLLAALKILTMATTMWGAVKSVILAKAMTSFAVAMLVFAFAMKKMGEMDTGEMLRSILGIALIMKIMTKSMTSMPLVTKGLGRAAFAMIGMAIALNILAFAMHNMSKLSWEELAKGLVGVAGAMLIMTTALRLMPKDLAKVGTSMIGISIALLILSGAMKVFATMSWEEMGKGMLGLAGSLALIGVAMHLFPKDMLAQAAALMILSSALVVITGTIFAMGKMRGEVLGQGLIGLAASLFILGAALMFMNGSLTGSAALLVAAGAVALLVPPLIALGSISVGTLITGLVALAATFTILGVAGMVLGPLTPVLIGLGVALLLIGAAAALTGAGVMMLGIGLSAVVASGTLGIALLVAIIKGIISMLPAFFAGVLEGLVVFIKGLTENVDVIFKFIETLIVGLLDTLIAILPKLMEALGEILSAIIKIVVDFIPDIVVAGIKFILGLLKGIADNIYRFVKIAVRIVAEFIRGLGAASGDLIDAAFDFVIDFMDGLAKAIDANAEEFGETAAELGIAIVKGAAKGMLGALNIIRDAAVDMAKSAWDAAAGWLGINSPSRKFMEGGYWNAAGMAKGMDDNQDLVARSGEGLGVAAYSAIRDSIAQVASAIDTGLDFNPTITPVLDLSNVEGGANSLSRLLSGNSIDVSGSVGAAESIALTPRFSDAPRDGSGDVFINLEQTNNSPKPLDPTEIYLNTRSQLALVKEALKS